jgi:hypothetical protein
LLLLCATAGAAIVLSFAAVALRENSAHHSLMIFGDLLLCVALLPATCKSKTAQASLCDLRMNLTATHHRYEPMISMFCHHALFPSGRTAIQV